MKLQACDGCGAQFDVSAFEPGQQFTCGSCGAVLVAHQAKAGGAPARKPAGRTPGSSGRTPAARGGGGGRKPGAPARGGGAPTRGGKGTSSGRRTAVSGGPGHSSRGPQFQPAQRQPAGGAAANKGRAPAPKGRAPAAPAARAPSGGRGGRAPAGRGGSRGAPGGAGGNKMMLPIVGGLAVIVIVVLMIVMGGSGDEGSGGNGTATKPDGTPNTPGSTPVVDEKPRTLADILADMGKNPPTTKGQYKYYIEDLKKLGPEGAEKLKDVYKQGIDSGALYGDDEARTALGYKKFDERIPEDLSFRDYPFIRAVEEASRKTWFAEDEDEEYALAMKAWAATETHLHKLEKDHVYRAGDQIRSYVKMSDPNKKQYFFATRWAEPYLICYATKDRMSEFDLMSIEDRGERRKKLKELRDKRKDYEVVLDEKALLYQQLYKEYMKRYGNQLGLKDLMAPWGGLPDLPPGKRSYPDGCPLVIWIFQNQAAWKDYHDNVVKNPLPPGVGGYFAWKDGWIYLFDHDDTGQRDRISEIGKNLHEGLHQIDYWFNKQMIKWREVKNQQDWINEGMAEYMSGVKIDKQRNVEFTGINVSRCEEMMNVAKQLAGEGKEYMKCVFPISRLIQFTSYGQVRSWGANEWQIHPWTVMIMFYQQSWVLTHFLHHYEDGKYVDKFNKYYELYLLRGSGRAEAARQFRAVFGFHEDEDFDEIQAEFEAYLKKFLDLDLSPYKYDPPGRDDWGPEGPPSARNGEDGDE